MSLRSTAVCSVFAIALLALPAWATAHHGPKKSRGPAKAEPQVAPQPVVPQPPPPPPTPEQMPASPPKVTMSGGQLSIVAENSTLGDVLSAVKGLTGASVEAPPSLTSQRVAVTLGPGEPQQVLQHLLAGSNFDYIILGSPTSPAAIQKIILTSRSAGAANGMPVNNAANQPSPGPYQQPVTQDSQADSGSVDDEIVQPEPPTPPEEATPQGEVGPNTQQMPPEQQGPKTPEQLLQELQRMQQQQQQMNRPQRVQPQ